MSAHAPELPQIDIGLGVLKIIGDREVFGNGQGRIIVFSLEGFAFKDNDLAVYKITTRFNGNCIFTNPWGTRDPCFIFTMGLTEKVKNPQGLLEKVRKDLQVFDTEIKILVTD